jgi:hypothetical protein
METQRTNGGKELLLSYVGMDMGYNQGKLMYIAGKEDAVAGNVGTLDCPVQAQGVTIAAQEKDVVLFSYNYTSGGQSSLRQLMGKLDAPNGVPARFSVLIPDASGSWVTQTADITLVYPDTKKVINPHGLAQYGNFLYLVDNETTEIVIVDADDLENAADSDAVDVESYDVSGDMTISYGGRGQAAIVLDECLYALFGDNDPDATFFGDSYLFRLVINSSTGGLTANAATTVGVNAQSIIPVNDGTNVQLLIPAIGGRQSLTGATNETASNICVVPAVGAWPASAPVKITGDPTATPVTAYDIHAVAAAMRDGSSALFILTQIYTSDSENPPASPTAASYRIYRTSVSEFLNITNGPAISTAVLSGALTVVDERTITSISGWGVAYGIYFWDILLEQVPDVSDDEGDRLWVGLGTPILVTSAAYENMIEDPAYGSPTSTFQNDYVEFGYFGGVNINAGAFDLLIETQNQARRGVSLKRTLSKSVALKSAARKSAALRTTEEDTETKE